MNITEALNVIKPHGNTKDDLKKAYRQACKKYHPDVNPHGLELMKVTNAAYSFLSKNINKWNHTQQSNDTSITDIMQAIFNKIKHFENIDAEACGSWLWVSGDTRKYKTELKAAGLFWARKKMQWYWRPEGYRKQSKKVLSMPEIRLMYGSIELDQEPVKAIA